VAALYVTHDQTEAMTLDIGWRCCVQACSNSVTLRKFSTTPDQLFVAGFIGSPAMNLFEGSLNSELTGVALGSQHIGLSSDVVTFTQSQAIRWPADRRWRTPEDLARPAMIVRRRFRGGG